MAKGESEEAAAKSPSKPSPPPASTAAAAALVVEELPKAIVRRVVKEKLSQLAASDSKSRSKSAKKGGGRGGGGGGGGGGGDGEGEEMSVHKDAILAFAESARIFIHYLSATANDICKESKRQTINADDVFKALEEIEFPEFLEPLRVSLEGFRRRNQVKKSEAKTKAKVTEKKRKLVEEEATQDGEDGENGAEEEDNEEEEDPDENE